MTAQHVFLDAEFVPIDGGPMLVSIGFVSDDMKEFYAERSEAELADAPWEQVGELVRSQVRSQLGARGVASGTMPEIAGQLVVWLKGLCADSIEVVYDYSADYGFIEELQQQAASSVWSRLVPIHVGYLLEDVDGAEAADAEWVRSASNEGCIGTTRWQMPGRFAHAFTLCTVDRPMAAQKMRMTMGEPTALSGACKAGAEQYWSGYEAMARS